MGMEAWKNLWTVIFFVASLAFYTIVLVVGSKGLADFKNMLVAMVAARRIPSADADTNGRQV